MVKFTRFFLAQLVSQLGLYSAVLQDVSLSKSLLDNVAHQIRTQFFGRAFLAAWTFRFNILKIDIVKISEYHEQCMLQSGT